MSRLLFATTLCVVLCAAPVHATDTASRFLQRTGGTVVESMEGKPGVLVLNAQRDATVEQISAVTVALQRMLRIPVRLTSAETPKKDWLETAALMAAGQDVVAVVVLCEAPALPSLLVAPEGKWALVNVAALKADAPPPAILGRRVARQLWRAAGYVLGAANSAFPVCLMKPVLKLGDLDALGADALSLEPLAGIRQQFTALGVVPARQSSYRRAVEEGWAPAPTNDIQRAIRDEVQAKAKAP